MRPLRVNPSRQNKPFWKTKDFAKKKKNSYGQNIHKTEMIVRVFNTKVLLKTSIKCTCTRKLRSSLTCKSFIGFFNKKRRQFKSQKIKVPFRNMIILSLTIVQLFVFYLPRAAFPFSVKGRDKKKCFHF